MASYSYSPATDDELNEIAQARNGNQDRGYTYSPATDDEMKDILAYRAANAKRGDVGVSPEGQSYLGDIAHSAASGVVKGAAGIPGIGGDVVGLVKRAHNWYYDVPKGSPDYWDPNRTYLPDTQDVLGVANQAVPGTQDFANYEPQTRAGKFANAVGSFIPGAATGGANVANILRYGVVPGLLSEGAGQTAEALGASPEWQTAARIAGGAGGSIAGGKLISPLGRSTAPEMASTNANLAEDVQLMKDNKIPVNPGQVAGNDMANRYYQQMNPERFQEQDAALTRAAIRNVDPTAPDNLRQAVPVIKQRANDMYDNAVKGSTPVTPDSQLAQKMLDVHQEFNRSNAPYSAGEKSAVNAAQRQIQDTFGAGTPGGIAAANPGDFKALDSSLGGQMAAAAEAGNTNAAHAIGDMRKELGDQMARHLQSQGLDPDAFRKADQYYKGYKTLEDIWEKPGTKTAGGNMSPAQLSQAAGQHGHDALGRLGEAATNVLRVPSSSGTNENSIISGLMKAPAMAGMAALGHLLGPSESPLTLGTILGAEAAIYPMAGAVSRMGLRPLTDSSLTRPYWGNQYTQNVTGGLPQGLLGVNQSFDPLRPHSPLHVDVAPTREELREAQRLQRLNLPPTQ